MIQIACPQCGLNLLLPDHLHGQEVTCSGCKKPVDTSSAQKMEERPRRDDPPRDSPDDDRDRNRDRDNRDRDNRDERNGRDERDRDRDRDQPRKEGDRPRQPSAPATCICLVIGGIVSLVAGLIFLAVTYYCAAYGPRFGRPDVFPVLVFSAILIVVTHVIPAVFEFIAAALLSRVEGYGLVMTGAILALAFGAVQTLFCGLAHLAFLASLFPNFNDEEMPLRLVAALILLGAGIFQLVAGGITLGTLSHGPVARIYQKQFHDPDDEYRPRRRDRDRDRDLAPRWNRRRWDY
jgi:hypothetical protein